MPAYSSIFQYIPGYSSLFQHILAYASIFPNSKSPIPNQQLEMPNGGFYAQLGILSVSSLLESSTAHPEHIHKWLAKHVPQGIHRK